MSTQNVSKHNSTSSIPAKRQRSYSQESISISPESSKYSNDSFMDVDSCNCSADKLKTSFSNCDEEDDDIEILLDPSQLDIEGQFVYEMCSISTF
ncbi:hypothetical protein F4703DRAFT_1927588 [Phycomyces blakesleeanus]